MLEFRRPLILSSMMVLIGAAAAGADPSPEGTPAPQPMPSALPTPTSVAVSIEECVAFYVWSNSCPIGCEETCACADYIASHGACLDGCEQACSAFEMYILGGGGTEIPTIAPTVSSTPTPYNGDIEYPPEFP